MQQLARVARIQEMSVLTDRARSDGRRIALVPTMGALHDGHLALVREAKSQADFVVVSVFVNPTQFGPSEDFDDYPRTLDDDIATLSAAGGVDVVFAPLAGEMYPSGDRDQRVWVDTSALDQVLCGKFRPGHFRGVATVVAKLFNVCRPHAAVFGLKDAQQFVILRKMVSDLQFDIEIVGVPTQREPGGLALSSRNRFLTKAEREQAVVLSKAVTLAEEKVTCGERDTGAIESAMMSVLQSAPLARVQYASVVDAEDLSRPEIMQPGQHVLAAVAVHFGETRLIDNAFSWSPTRQADRRSFRRPQ